MICATQRRSVHASNEYFWARAATSLLLMIPACDCSDGE
jgi:hypothetical protein